MSERIRHRSPSRPAEQPFKEAGHPKLSVKFNSREMDWLVAASGDENVSLAEIVRRCVRAQMRATVDA